MASSPVQSGLVSESRATSRASYFVWYFAFFVISGLCGLVCEVVWVRLAMASFGVTTGLVSIVLSIFMGGLGLGCWGAGVLVRRMRGLNAPRALRLYAVTELLIGCSSIAVPAELKLGRALLLRAGGFAAWQSWHYYVIAGAWLAVALLPWCTLLGATFPLLMSVIRAASPDESEQSFSYLYVANVLGALLGTLISAFVLIELFGFRRTLWIGGVCNAALALIAAVISRNLRGSIVRAERPARAEAGQGLYGLPRNAVPVMLFTTGLVSMGSEVVWMREYTPYLGNFVYAFAVIVAIYLLATCIGARDYRRWSRTHASSESIKVWSLLALSVLIPVLGASPMLPFGPSRFAGIRILAIWLFCALTGFLTPLLVDDWSGGEPAKAGTGYAFNVVGCIAGPLIASFCLVPWMGERWSLLVLSLPIFAIAGSLGFSAKQTGQSGLSSRKTFIVVLAISLVLMCCTSDYETVFPERKVRRDYAATVIAAGRGFDRTLVVNGVGMTFLSPVTKYIADLPLASMNRPPRNGLVICFGMGTTFRSMVSWGIPTTAVDLIPSVPKLFSYFHADAAEVERSPNAKIVVDDGRRFLDGANERYDVIVVDPPPPLAAPGSSLLYSKEFYDVVKSHLSEDGVFQSWYPLSLVGGEDAGTTASVAKTLSQSFPYVRAFRSYDLGIHFLASRHPILMESGAVLASRTPRAAAADLLEWGPEHDLAAQYDLMLRREISVEQLDQLAPDVPVLTDDQPVNEYFLLRHWLHLSR